VRIFPLGILLRVAASHIWLLMSRSICDAQAGDAQNYMLTHSRGSGRLVVSVSFGSSFYVCGIWPGNQYVRIPSS